MKQVAPALQKWLDDFNQSLEELLQQGFKQNPTNAREGLANLTHVLVTDIPKVSWVQDDIVNAQQYAIPVRIYHPTPDTRLPVLIYYHGGGHMAGSVTVYDPICRKLSLATNHIVVSVDYRLAPECPYPTNYFQNGENRKAASPLYMEFSPKLPETIVITAQFCPLRDEEARNQFLQYTAIG